MNDAERQHAVIRFKRDVTFPRFSMKKGERWGFVIFGKMMDRLAAIKSGERFEFAGGQCLAEDVEVIYEGPCNLNYSIAAGYVQARVQEPVSTEADGSSSDLSPRKGGTSDFGPWQIGEQVTDVSQIEVGDILFSDSVQFDALNLCRVVRKNTQFGDRVYATFVNPFNTLQGRAGGMQEDDFCIWDVEMAGNNPYGNRFMRAIKVEPLLASDIPCYAVYSADFHFSDAWGNKMIALWIATKQALVRGEIDADQFRDTLIDGIIRTADWRSDFNDAARDVGADANDDRLFEEYVQLHRANAFELIPKTLHSEFCWVPGWDGWCIEDLIESNGLRSDRWKSSYIEDVQPGNWLAVFLSLVNQSSAELIRVAVEEFGDNGKTFADKCHAANFNVEKDPARPSLMSGKEVISAIENAYSQAVPMFHCQVNVRALFELDPTKAMRMVSPSGKVHLGLHEFINGAGYLDTYPGEVVIPAEAAGFGGVKTWRYGVNEVYGLVKSSFITPLPA